MRRFEKLGFSIFFVHCKQCIWLYMPFLLCKYAYFHYVEYLVNIYPSRNVVSNCTIFCVYSIRDGYTKWVRYQIIVRLLQLLCFSMLLIMMLGEGMKREKDFVKAILLLFFLHLPERRIKYKRNFHHIQFGIY